MKNVSFEKVPVGGEFTLHDHADPEQTGAECMKIDPTELCHNGTKMMSFNAYEVEPHSTKKDGTPLHRGHSIDNARLVLVGDELYEQILAVE